MYELKSKVKQGKTPGKLTTKTASSGPENDCKESETGQEVTVKNPIQANAGSKKSY